MARSFKFGVRGRDSKKGGHEKALLGMNIIRLAEVIHLTFISAMAVWRFWLDCNVYTNRIQLPCGPAPPPCLGPAAKKLGLIGGVASWDT